jgi:hypothetical protein
LIVNHAGKEVKNSYFLTKNFSILSKSQFFFNPNLHAKFIPEFTDCEPYI